jgi:hypothetical protein
MGLEWELSSPPPYHSWTEPPSLGAIDAHVPPHPVHD